MSAPRALEKHKAPPRAPTCKTFLKAGGEAGGPHAYGGPPADRRRARARARALSTRKIKNRFQIQDLFDKYFIKKH